MQYCNVFKSLYDIALKGVCLAVCIFAARTACVALAVAVHNFITPVFIVDASNNLQRPRVCLYITMAVPNIDILL